MFYLRRATGAGGASERQRCRRGARATAAQRCFSRRATVSAQVSCLVTTVTSSRAGASSGVSRTQSVTPGLTGTWPVPTHDVAAAPRRLAASPAQGLRGPRGLRLTPPDRPGPGAASHGGIITTTGGVVGRLQRLREVGQRLEVKKKFQLLGRAHIFPI